MLRTILRSTKVRHSSVTIELARAMELSVVGDTSIGDEPGSNANDDEGNSDSSSCPDESTNAKLCRYGVNSFKVPSKCDKCGAIVRRDVMMRHQKTAKCKARVHHAEKNQGKSMHKKVQMKMTKGTKATARQLQRR